MLVKYYVQDLLLAARDNVSEALSRLTIDHQFSRFNVVRLAQAERQMYLAQTSLYETPATVRADCTSFLPIANPLDKSFDDYDTKTPAPIGPKLNPFLLMPAIDQAMDVSALASYQTIEDRVSTLHITARVQQVLSSHIPSVSEQQLHEAFAM